MIEVDGSYGEGGGQILRTTLALSAVLGQEVRVVKIRAGRPRPGLMAQHLTGVSAVRELCEGELDGARIGSEELIFKPKKLRAGKFHFDVGTAGSITLVLQALMPVVAFAPGPVELQITGGTDVKWSPPIDFLSLVELPILEKYGYSGRIELERRGHYPKGGGYVRFSSQPSQGFKAVVGEEPGIIVRTFGVSHASGLPMRVAVRQSESAQKVIVSAGYPTPEIRLQGGEERSRLDIGSGIVLVAGARNGALLAGDSLGDRGLPAENVGRDAALKLIEDLKTDCYFDRHMADTIIPFAALANGRSQASIARVTKHVQTNIKIAELLAGVTFRLAGELDQRGSFSVEGLGQQP